MNERSGLSNVERWTVFIDTFGRPFDVEDGVSPHAGASSTDGSRAVEVVSASQLEGAVEALCEFQEGLIGALNAHGVPAMPSWREAIDWLAAHGGQ